MNRSGIFSPNVLWAASSILLLAAAFLVGSKLAGDNQTLHGVRDDAGQISRTKRQSDPLRAEKENTLPKQANGDGASSRDAPVENTDHEFGPARLLANFELSGDLNCLQEAQTQFPNDTQVMLVSAVLAKDPEDAWLKRVEAREPDNGMPNLIRASLLADSAHHDEFREEFLKAISKSTLNTGSRARLAAMLDRIIETGQLPKTLVPDTDISYFKSLERIVRFMDQSRAMFGDEDKSSNYALTFAQRLRDQGGVFNMASAFAGNVIELEVLGRFRDDDWYGTSGMTVAERRREINKFGNWYHNKILGSKYHEILMNPAKYPTLSMQLITRMRADGEKSAAQWLLGR